MPGAATLAPLAYAAALDQACLHAYYKRFAQLTAAQKASARNMYHKQRHVEVSIFGEYTTVTPLVDCWFLPLLDGTVGQVGFYTEQPTRQSFFVLNCH